MKPSNSSTSTSLPRIGLQVHTVRDDLQADFAGTLRRLAAIGYEGVEFAGNYGGLEPAALRDLLDGLGLVTVATHVGAPRLMDDLPSEIDRAKALGASTIVCPGTPANIRSSESAWAEFIPLLHGWARSCADEGIALAYHTHPFDLELTVSGVPALHAILDPASSLQVELDIAWVHAAGRSPTAYQERYAGRQTLLHVKDYRREAEENLTVELGRGMVDLHASLDLAIRQQIAWLVVEQDKCFKAPLESVRDSRAFLAEWMRIALVA